MAFRTHLLVVANQTVDAPELLAAIRERAARGPVHATLLVPCLYSERTQASARAQAAGAELAPDGIQAETLLGDADPIVAVQETWHPGRYDEVIVSTLEASVSRWLQIDLPHRVAKLTDCQVRHVAVPARRPEAEHPPQPPPAPRPRLESMLSLMRSGRGSNAA
jgi:hypothetical protein